METGRSGTRRSVHFRGQTVFLETEVKKTQFYRSGELEKYLKKLGSKIEEYLTPGVDYVVTNDKDKISLYGNNHPNKETKSPNPIQPTIYESRAQKSLRLAMASSSNPEKVRNSQNSKKGKNEKNQKILHIDDFIKLGLDDSSLLD
jgi:hypothetical protein